MSHINDVRELGEELSGPWSGWSIQDQLRITESLRLIIHGANISGTGSDLDGEFDVQGSYHIRSGRVMLTRTYSYTTEPSQEGVGIPYDYEGVWDGQMVSGRWHPRSHPAYGGPFEMWPQREEEGLQIEEFIQSDQLVTPQSGQ